MIVRSVAEEKRKKIRKRRIISQTFLLFLDVMIPIYLVGTKHVWGTEQMIIMNFLFVVPIYTLIIFFTIFKYVIIKDVYESQKFNQWLEM